MENPRVLVDGAAIIACCDELEGVPAAFVYHVDETGGSESEDAQETRILVPDPYPGSSINVPVDRNTRRSTLVGAIASDGSTVRPMVIVERVTIESDVRLYE
jgi:hypothetical protein